MFQPKEQHPCFHCCHNLCAFSPSRNLRELQEQYDDETGGKQLSAWGMAGQRVQLKRKHKYLGIILSGDTVHRAFTKERDAMVVQAKQKVRAMREQLGEAIAHKMRLQQ